MLYRAPSRGLSFKTTMGNALTLTPPLTLSEADLDRALDSLAACIGEEARAPARTPPTSSPAARDLTPAQKPS